MGGWNERILFRIMRLFGWVRSSLQLRDDMVVRIGSGAKRGEKG